MAVVIGIEARIVLRDICGLDDAQILETERLGGARLACCGARVALTTNRTAPESAFGAPASPVSAHRTTRQNAQSSFGKNLRSSVFSSASDL